MTKVPISAKLIDASLLNSHEVAWIDAYHRECRTLLSPLMADQAEFAEGLEWLVRETQPLRVGAER